MTVQVVIKAAFQITETGLHPYCAEMSLAESKEVYYGRQVKAKLVA